MSWLIWWNSEIDLKKAGREGTEVSRFVLGARHFGEICARFAQLIARISLLIRWNSEIDSEKAESDGREVYRFVWEQDILVSYDHGLPT